MRIIIIGHTVLIISILVFSLMSSNFSEWLILKAPFLVCKIYNHRIFV